MTAPGGAASPLVGMMAGRSVGGAVERNRAKRRLRAALGRVVLRPDGDYVIIAGRAVLEARFEELVAWVVRAVEGQVRET